MAESCPSQGRKGTMVAAMEAVHAQRVHLEQGGVSRFSFFVGVANLVLTTFIVAKWPQHYWVWHTVKCMVLLPVKVIWSFSKKEQLYLLDFCWVTNFLLCFLSVWVLLDLATPQTPLIAVSEDTRTKFWFTFFVLGSGPLGWSVAATGNALIFHSWPNAAALFIHSSPMLASWCLRWNRDAFFASYPNLLAIPDVAPPALQGLIIPTFKVYLIWWVPYTIWLLTDGVTRPERGYDTVYRFWEPQLAKMTGLDSSRANAGVYMIIHAVGVAGTISTGVIAYSSFIYHTIFAIAMMSSAAWNGSKRYEYYLLQMYEKTLVKVQQEREKEKPS